MLEQFSATVEKIYAAAADPSLWEEALRSIEDYTGSTGAVLNLVPKTADAIPLCLAGSFSADDCSHYALNYMWRCPRIAFGKAHPDIPIHYDSMILSEYEMDRDPTYEWYGKHGLRYYVAGWIGESGTHRAYMSLQRSRRQGHVEEGQVHQFALIIRHMERALSLAVKLGTLEQQSRFGLELADSLPFSIVALDGCGNVLHANRAAERMLSDGDGLVVFQSRLQCRLTSQQPLLDRLISGACGTDPFRPGGGWMRVHRASGRVPHVVVVSRLELEDLPYSAFRPRVLVIVADALHARVADPEAMHQVFDLTAAEASLASALAAGHSVESACALMGIKASTARSQLKTVFRKVGVTRQQDLVRVLTTLSSLPSST